MSEQQRHPDEQVFHPLVHPERARQFAQTVLHGKHALDRRDPRDPGREPFADDDRARRAAPHRKVEGGVASVDECALWKNALQRAQLFRAGVVHPAVAGDDVIEKP